MRSLFFVSAFALLTCACVQHDPDMEILEEPYWEQTQPQPQTVLVEQTQPSKVVVQRSVTQKQTQPTTVAVTQPVVVTKSVAAETAPKQTWWQENRKKHVVKVVTPACPCEDPNDPCTQCYQK